MKTSLSLALALGILPIVQANAGCKSPNIVLIYCDDMGYGDLGCTGNPSIRTPNIDRIAMEGIRFTNYYSASPASSASRYSMLTGKYPPRSGFTWVLGPRSAIGIHPDEITQAEALRSMGYRTAIFGKWHLGSTKRDYLPLQNGFDRYIGLPYSNDMLRPPIALMSGNDTLEMSPDQSRLTEMYTREAIAFIKENRKNNFFVYIPFAMPHTPLHPGKKFEGKSIRGSYGDAVEEIDWAVGEILAALRKEKLDKNTILWFISDNGPWLIQGKSGGSSGLFRDGKGSTWEGGVRVPCIAYCPAIVSCGVNDRLVTAMDVYVTDLWLGGYHIPTDYIMDGYNIASYLGYKNVPEKSDTTFLYTGYQNRPFAIRHGKWKLHLNTYSQLKIDYFNGKLPLLFNLEEDPSEKYDLSDKYPEIVEKLERLYHQKVKEVYNTGCYYSNEERYRIQY